MVKNFLPETLTLPLPLACSVSKPKLSQSVKFYQNHFHKEKPGKKKALSTCKRGKKARAAGTIKNKQTLPAVYIPLLFYCGSTSSGACIPLLCFFAVLASGSGA
jgi:hypothetical protein